MFSFRTSPHWKLAHAALAAIVAIALLTLQPSAPAHAAAYTVTITGDTGAGSLRQAILDANANPGLDTITFNIGGPLPYLITLAGDLPAITGPVVIDATGQQGYTVQPIVWIDGGSHTCFDLEAGSDGSTIKGLSIGGCKYAGIFMNKSGGHTIQANFIGTHDGVIPLANGGDGIYALNGSDLNFIGGTGAGEGNLVSANAASGIRIEQSDSNFVRGNRVGTDITGGQPMPNLLNGIFLLSSLYDTIGGPEPGARNVVSGNTVHGIELTNLSSWNLIQGNIVGLDATGVYPLGNGKNGIAIFSNAPNNFIGDATPGTGNIISANGENGIMMQSVGNTVSGNYIGTDITGTVAQGNRLDGIQDVDPYNITEDIGNVIGSSQPAGANVISGNLGDGISLIAVEKDNIWRNYVGTDATGSIDLGNGANGVSIEASDYTLVGGNGGLGNWVLFNDKAGVYVAGSDGVSIVANRIRRNNTGIKLDNAATVATIANNCIAGNKLLGLKNLTTTTALAENNWWGSVTGPKHATNPGGTGDGVSDFVDFDPWVITSCTALLGP